MAWQDDLRALDGELAAGRISADEYRVRRDKFLAAAVSDTGESAANHGAVGESTQFIQPAQAADEGDRTQAMGGWRSSQPNADTTQRVPGVPSQAGPGGQPPRPAPGGHPPQRSGEYGPPPWQQEEFAPPWAGTEFPPLASAGSPDWARQGPEVFETEGRSTGTRILLTVLVVVLLAGAGVASYFLFFKEDSGNQAQPNPSGSQSEPPSTTSSAPRDDLSIAELPGELEDHSDLTTFSAAETSGFLAEEEIAIYREAGADRCRVAASATDDQVHALVFTTQATSPDAAKAASGKLAQQQLIYGMTAYDNAPANVGAAEFPKNEKTPATIRAHYYYQETIVRIQVNGDDLNDVADVFDDLVAAQLEVLDADD